MLSIKKELENILKQDTYFCDAESGELDYVKIIDCADKMDEKLINLLASHQALRDKFFVKINPPRLSGTPQEGNKSTPPLRGTPQEGNKSTPPLRGTPQEGNKSTPPLRGTPQEGNCWYVFKTNDFRFFIEENKIDNSYTKYKNRIGLTDGKKFLKDTNDVVLDWPYKDCVLEGGQSTEEGTDTYFEYDGKSTPPLRGTPQEGNKSTMPLRGTPQEGNKSTPPSNDGTLQKGASHEVVTYQQKQAKRKEIFFNSVLAHDEIDRLFDPKALVNWKRFTKDGEIPLLRGGDEVDGVESWQQKSLFPYWTLPKNKNLTERAKELRKQGILSEVLFWQAFKNKEKLKGYDIDRQVIIGDFIVDFFIAELGLVIEIDGSSHDDKQEYDQERQSFLEGLNLQVIRYTDAEVKQNIDGIYQDLLNNLKLREQQLSTSPARQEEKIPLLRGGDEVDGVELQTSSTSPAKAGTPQEENGKEVHGGGIFKRDEDGTIKENLIIKGNNLLALHSLKKQFAGKVKLIYIDPPYNTGNDGFKYNDNFNHSTWLTFMKNRLEVAKELLRDDGVIFVSCDDNEQAYLKVLMDDIFGKENFISNIVVVSAPAGTQSSVNIAQKHSYCISFSKSKNFKTFKLKSNGESLNKKYNEKDNLGKFYIERLWKRGIGGMKEDVPSLHFPIFYDPKNKKIYIDDEYNDKENLIKIIPYQTKNVLGRWTWSKDKMKAERDKLIVKLTNNEYKLYKKVYLFEEQGRLPESIIGADIGRTEIGSLEIKKLFNNKVFAYPKPESLLQRIIEISTQPNDIVLDYHLGSGTTAAVAHKMGRQYIGIEQMDYIETIAVERLKKVIGKSTSPAKAGTPQEENFNRVVSFDTGGISKAVNWQGGGDFIYCELAKWNETAKEKILACESLEELINFFDEMYEKYFLNYNLKIKEFREKVVKEEEFQKLSLDEQKKMFVAMLDNNQLYVNKTEMADKKFGISEEDQTLTREFYR